MIRVYRIYRKQDIPDVYCKMPLVVMACDSNGDFLCINSGYLPEEIAQRTPESFVGGQRTDNLGRKYIELVQGQ